MGLGWIAAIIVGGFAGWIASSLMGARTGILVNIALGILGALVGRFALGIIGLAPAGGWIGQGVAGLVGACILIALARLIRR